MSKNAFYNIKKKGRKIVLHFSNEGGSRSRAINLPFFFVLYVFFVFYYYNKIQPCKMQHSPSDRNFHLNNKIHITEQIYFGILILKWNMGFSFPFFCLIIPSPNSYPPPPLSSCAGASFLVLNLIIFVFSPPLFLSSEKKVIIAIVK